MSEREALIEALARIEVMGDGGGDFGGPFHTEDGHAVDMYVKYVEPCHSEPPDWDRVSDPLAEFFDQHDAEVRARANEIRGRVRSSVADYARRTGYFKTWWRSAPQPTVQDHADGSGA